jgi:hypothetical protein
MADEFEWRQRGAHGPMRGISEGSPSRKVGVPTRVHSLFKKAVQKAGSDIAVTAVVTLAVLSACGGVAATAAAGSNLNAVVPDAPANLNAPTNLVFDDEFDAGSLNTTVWSPDWFGNGSTQNGTVMDSSNVSVDANGLELKLNTDSTGAIVSSNPDDGQPGHTGFQIAPTPSQSVYVEYTATLPSTNGVIANWPGLWLTGQNWPLTGEIDVMEGFSTSQYHIESGPNASDVSNPGGVGGATAGTHTYGVLWTTTGVTFVYDGQVVGTLNAVLSGPMYLVMENSLGSPALLGATVTVRDVRVWTTTATSVPTTAATQTTVPPTTLPTTSTTTTIPATSAMTTTTVPTISNPASIALSSPMSGFTCAAINRLDFSQLTSSDFVFNVANRVAALMSQSSGELLNEVAPLESAIASSNESEAIGILKYLQAWVCPSIGVPPANS